MGALHIGGPSAFPEMDICKKGVRKETISAAEAAVWYVDAFVGFTTPWMALTVSVPVVLLCFCFYNFVLC